MSQTTTPASAKQKLFHLSHRTASLTGVQILSCGGYVPQRVVTNEELEEQYGFEPGWIQRRTGILSRRYAEENEATSDMATEAAKQALERAGLTAADIDLVVVGTFTPDFLCPSTACLVQERLGIDAPAMDVQAACSGFMYALSTGMQFVATGNAKYALVIGADTNSRIVDPQDQRTAPLFGDGAGAVILTAGDADQGLVQYQLGSDGGGGSLLERPSGGTKLPTVTDHLLQGEQYLKMDGRTVFKWAIQAVTETIQFILDSANVSPDEVKLFALHQANVRILDHACKELGLSPDRVLNNLDSYGNTSAASIPLVLEDALRENRLERGDLVLMCGFGAGLTWGTGLFRW